MTDVSTLFEFCASRWRKRKNKKAVPAWPYVPLVPDLVTSSSLSTVSGTAHLCEGCGAPSTGTALYNFYDSDGTTSDGWKCMSCLFAEKRVPKWMTAP